MFELLQNADDNKYTKARASGAEPFVSFAVYEDQVIFECNEDGFSQENLEAICSVGQSSKTGAQSYIGEKGIGFKSVFMVASNVHIQSGSFSFSFKHKPGDPGMGMISPIWEETEEELATPLTRITLYLHNTGDAGQREMIRQSIREQFEELQETILLFMKNLKKIVVRFYDENGQEISVATRSIRWPEPNSALLSREVVADGAVDQSVARFHVTRHEATNLSKNENRTYSEREEASQAYSKSEIVLAFPLSDDSVPIIKPQELFAFLPVRKVGFNFLIQADFVTDANRQDIVVDSPRNRDLVNEIAGAFVKAVVQFCKHETLRFQWMRYLPGREDNSRGPLWASLVDEIAKLLGSTPVLYGRREPYLRCIDMLYRPQPWILDEDGAPLFDDSNLEWVVSDRYERKDLDILESYDLNYVNWAMVWQWLEKDLAREGDQSRWRSSDSPDPWRTRASAMLCRLVDENAEYVKKVLQGIKLIPLQNGIWVAAKRPVYFPHIDGVAIPSDLGLQLISEDVTNAQNKQLLKKLGAKTASVDGVRRKILDKYSTASAPSPSAVTLEVSKQHLAFLYLTHNVRGKDDGGPSEYELWIYNDAGRFCSPLQTLVYIGDDEPYGPRELFRKTDPGSAPGDGAPGHYEHFVNRAYFEDVPTKPPGQRLGWREWFYEALAVTKHLWITDKSAQYLQEYRPEKFLKALQMHPKNNKRNLSDSCIQVFKEAEILCRGNRRYRLKDAYLPTKDLERRVEQFVEPGAYFPWLWLDAEATPDAVPAELKDLLMRSNVPVPIPDLDFALAMLKFSVEGFPDEPTRESQERLFRLYEHIQGKYREHADKNSAGKKITYDPSALISAFFFFFFSYSLGTGLHTNECVCAHSRNII